jgi:hypothetical protein
MENNGGKSEKTILNSFHSSQPITPLFPHYSTIPVFQYSNCNNTPDFRYDQRLTEIHRINVPYIEGHLVTFMIS